MAVYMTSWRGYWWANLVAQLDFAEWWWTAEASIRFGLGR